MAEMIEAYHRRNEAEVKRLREEHRALLLLAEELVRELLMHCPAGASAHQAQLDLILEAQRTYGTSGGSDGTA